MLEKLTIHMQYKEASWLKIIVFLKKIIKIHFFFIKN